MPLIARRPVVFELLNIAVEQEKKLVASRLEMLERPVTIWFRADRGGGEKPQWEKALLTVSRFCEKIRRHIVGRIVLASLLPMALTVLAYEAPQHDFHVSNITDARAIVVDTVVNVLFLIDGLMRMLGVYVNIKIEEAFNRKVSKFQIFQQSGLVDFVLTSLCLNYGISPVGLWLRLLRFVFAINSSTLQFLPHVEVLLSGIYYGIRSTSTTILLLFLLIFVYAIAGFYFFAQNDPLRFGSYWLSVLTLFQISTFDNMGLVVSLNALGCDSYPSEYSPGSAQTVATVWGDFQLPKCSNPQPQGVTSQILFFSFSFFSGYVMMSMCLAAVVIGINERLEILRTKEVYGTADTDNVNGEKSQSTKYGQVSVLFKSAVTSVRGNNDNTNITAHKARRGSNGAVSSKEKLASDMKAGKMLGKQQSEDVRTQILLDKLWADVIVGRDGIRRLTGTNARRGSGDIPVQVEDPRVRIAKDVFNGVYYRGFMVLLIVIDAVLEIVENSENRTTAGGDVVHAALLVFFFANILFSCYIHMVEKQQAFYKWFIDSSWNVLDVLVNLAVIIPMCAPRVQPLGFLRSFRLLRLALILKELQKSAPDLAIVLSALGSSVYPLCLMAFILLVFIMLCSIASVLLFKQADPYNFGDLSASFQTLLLITSLDNWSDIMRRCIFGCQNYGFGTGIPAYDDSCNSVSGEGVGWWAPIFFVPFVILSSMVLVSLLIGVIITSMELLREGFLEESRVLTRAEQLRDKYRLRPATFVLMRELFERLDVAQNGMLHYDTLSTIRESIEMNESAFSEVYITVDEDRNGRVDFAEFVIMISRLRRILKARSRQGTQALQHSRSNGSLPSLSASNSVSFLRRPSNGNVDSSFVPSHASSCADLHSASFMARGFNGGGARWNNQTSAFSLVLNSSHSGASNGLSHARVAPTGDVSEAKFLEVVHGMGMSAGMVGIVEENEDSSLGPTGSVRQQPRSDRAISIRIHPPATEDPFPPTDEEIARSHNTVSTSRDFSLRGIHLASYSDRTLINAGTSADHSQIPVGEEGDQAQGGGWGGGGAIPPLLGAQSRSRSAVRSKSKKRMGEKTGSYPTSDIVPQAAPEGPVSPYISYQHTAAAATAALADSGGEGQEEDRPVERNAEAAPTTLSPLVGPESACAGGSGGGGRFTSELDDSRPPDRTQCQIAAVVVDPTKLTAETVQPGVVSSTFPILPIRPPQQSFFGQSPRIGTSYGTPFYSASVPITPITANLLTQPVFTLAMAYTDDPQSHPRPSGSTGGHTAGVQTAPTYEFVPGVVSRP